MPGFGSAAPDADYELNSLFRLEIDGIQVMAFEKVTIGDSEWTEGTSRTGIDGLIKNTFSGLKNPQEITLEKEARVGGAADINQIIEWHQSGSSDRRNGAIIQLNRGGNPIMRLNFSRAWVKKWTPPEWDASADDTAARHTFVLSVPEVSLG